MKTKTANLIRVQIPNTLIGVAAVSSICDIAKNFIATKILVLPIAEKTLDKFDILTRNEAAPVQKDSSEFEYIDDRPQFT